MHEISVYVLCALVVFFAFHDGRILFISWYSGVDPPLSASTKVWAWLRIALCVLAVAASLLTL